MGLLDFYGLGRDGRMIVTPETAFGTRLYPSDANSSAEIAYKSFTAEKNVERVERIDKRPARGRYGRIERRTKVTWSLETYCFPLGLTATTLRNLAPLLAATFGTETLTPATDVTYTPVDTQNGLGSLTLDHLMSGGTMLRTLCGAVVNSMTFRAAGGEEPMLTFEGMAQDLFETANSAQVGAVAGNDITVTAGEGGVFEAGYSVIQAGSDDNSGAGHTIASISTDTLTLDATPTSSATDLILPFLPSLTNGAYPTQQPIDGISGQVTLTPSVRGTSNIDLTNFEFTLSNNLIPNDKEAFRRTDRDYNPGNRDVTGNIGWLMTRDMAAKIKLLQGAEGVFTLRDLQVMVGGTSGANRCIIDMDQIELQKFVAKEEPETDEVSVTAEFRALLSTGTAVDDISMQFV